MGKMANLKPKIAIQADIVAGKVVSVAGKVVNLVFQ